MRTSGLKNVIHSMAYLDLVQTRQCESTETYKFLSTQFLQRITRLEYGKYYNEPKSPFDLTLQDRLFGNLECGKPATDVTKAILSGHAAPEKAWPWQVLLLIPNTISLAGCGGVLISNSWVLTAAHCMQSKDIAIVLGDPVAPQQTQLFKVRKIITHEEYYGDMPADDIALIKLDKDVNFSDYVKPVCLPRFGVSLASDEFCYVTGWGLTNHTARTNSEVLQQIKVHIMPQSLCSYMYRMMSKLSILDGRNLCLDINDYNRAICDGDSGGPLSCKINGRFEVIGLVHASGENCSASLTAGIFTRVSEYLDWIVTKIAESDL